MPQERKNALPAERGPDVSYTGKKKRIRVIRILAAVAVILALAVSIAAEAALRPKMAGLARAESLKRLSVIASEVTREAAGSGDFAYENLVKMEFDPSGRLIAVRCDTGALNVLSARLVGEVQSRLENEKAFTVRLPLGTLFGGYLFAGKGLPLRVKIVPVGGVTGEIQSRVETAGINQSRHVILLCLTFDVVAALPGRDEAIAETLSIPLCDNLFLGEVPQIYRR